MTKEYLKETAKEFIEKYPERLNQFLNEFEADENNFIDRELRSFEDIWFYLENPEASYLGSSSGFANLQLAIKICDEVGYEKFEYSTKKKIYFLQGRRSSLISEVVNATPKAIPVFKLSTKKGVKTNLIRVLSALYELRFFCKPDGQIPDKGEFMKTMGNYFGVDLSKYHSNLSQAMQEQPLEVNLKVFEEMKEAIKNAHYQTKPK